MRVFKRLLLAVAASLTICLPKAEAADGPRNLVLFVADGLRARIVNAQTAPTMAAIRNKGVHFANPHSLFPTFTMPNASAMATGHYLGDTGVFSNTLYAGYPVEVPGMGKTVTPFLENDPVLGDIDAHFAGDFIDEETILKAARAKGLRTAAVGKLGPVHVFDHTENSGEQTVTLDDQTGTNLGIPIAQWMRDGLTKAGLPTAAVKRDQPAGNMSTPGTTNANVGQQKWFADAVTKVILPQFKEDNRGFVLVFWSRDPDGTQHNQGDSLLQLTPGINGPTSLASIRNADDNLAQIKQAIADLGLEDTTDIVVTADHGFSTISKQSETSPAAKATYSDVPPGFLPPGFVAIDLAQALDLPLIDPDQKHKRIGAGEHPRLGNGLLGPDPLDTKVIVAANGGSDLIYLRKPDRELATKVVDALLAQDYVSGIFVDESLGTIPGTMPLSAVNLQGSAVTPMPTIAISFKSFATGCDEAVLCTVEVADTALQQGQGMHGSFSRADTMNFMAAIGPSFKRHFVDSAPVSNADLGKTIAAILNLDPQSRGKLVGRVLDEARPGGEIPDFESRTLRADPANERLATVLRYQLVGSTRYFDAAGFSGRTVGLE